MGKYRLQTVASGRVFDDSGWILDDSECEKPSLLRTVYVQKQIRFGAKEDGIYRFSDWLPIKRTLKGSSAPITYKSEGLAKALGLDNLYITMSGYYPKVGAMMTTCSFKETEAFSVCGRIESDDDKILVVASAGNTARAFAKVCSENGIKLLLCVPSDNLDALWFDSPLQDCVKLVCCESGGDYFDAIALGNVAVKSGRFYAEGGAKNVARRDGMATTMLSAVEVIGRVPDFYFQAVGSGTGAIAAWEANLRLLEDGRFGAHKSRLIVSQNYPFIPMYDAWKAGSRDLLKFDDSKARGQVELIDAKVLSNRRPPYSIYGGLYDALVDSRGDVVHVDNSRAAQAGELFKSKEGVDIHPAACVAVGSLIDSVRNGVVSKESVVMLNITGAGEQLYKSSIEELHYLKPDLVFELCASEGEILNKIEGLF